jgi:hypothetical protein
MNGLMASPFQFMQSIAYGNTGGQLTETTYDYDIANRLESVNGVAYEWDLNGNLRFDGVNTYAYDDTKW